MGSRRGADGVAVWVIVIPAQAGIQGSRIRMLQHASAMNALDSRLRGNDGFYAFGNVTPRCPWYLPPRSL